MWSPGHCQDLELQVVASYNSSQLFGRVSDSNNNLCMSNKCIFLSPVLAKQLQELETVLNSSLFKSRMNVKKHVVLMSSNLVCTSAIIRILCRRFSPCDKIHVVRHGTTCVASSEKDINKISAQQASNMQRVSKTSVQICMNLYMFRSTFLRLFDCDWTVLFFVLFTWMIIFKIVSVWKGNWVEIELMTLPSKAIANLRSFCRVITY